MEEKEDKLNDLLEDALNDLLLDGHETVESETAEGPERKVEESLRVKELTGGGAGGKSGHGVRAKKESNGKRNQDDNGAGGSSSGGGSNTKFSNEESGFPNEEEMNRFFEDMTAKLKAELPKIDPEEARAKINESVPQIFDLMQNLLSKELLYPALKDLSPKFGEWLKKNSITLSKADKRRYRKQKEIIDEIIYLFEDESINSQERFEKNLDLMETMQSLGSPPEELTVPEGVGRCSVI